METKLLHAAVTQHGRARKEVQEAQAARFNMHSVWRNFLSQSVEQWKYSTPPSSEEQEKSRTERVQLGKTIIFNGKTIMFNG